MCYGCCVCTGSKVLAERLRKNATLTSLDMSSNPLKNEGASYMAQVSFHFFARDVATGRSMRASTYIQLTRPYTVHQ